MAEVNIGVKVQGFRKKNGMSLRELAGLVELSPSMLSQIENNSVNPSINTLKNISEALRVPLFKFFEEDSQPDNLVVRKGNYKTIGQPGQEVLYNLLTQDVSGNIEFCMMEIPSGTTTTEVPREHIGEEVAYVVSGEVDIILNGYTYRLSEGDAIKIPPMSPHQWTNNSAKEVKVVFAVTPPSF